MERGGWCWSPAPPSPAGRLRIQRLLEQPEYSGPDWSQGLQRIAEPLAGILPTRPPHSQTGRQLSGSSPWSAPPGAQGRGEPGTCACCGEVSPGPPGVFPSPAGAASCKLQQLGWVEGWESGAAGKLETGWKGCRGQESGFLGFNAVQGHLSWGRLWCCCAPATPPAPGSRSAGLQQWRRPRASAWGGGVKDRRRKGWDRSAEPGPRWRLSRGRAGKPGKGRVRESRRVGTRGRLRV